MSKTCTKCLLDKPLIEFYSGRSECKECQLAYKAMHYISNKDNKLLYEKGFYRDHKVEKAAYNAQYREDNYVQIAKAKSEYYIANKEAVLASKKIYNNANPGKLRALAAKSRAARRHATPKWLTFSQLKEIEEFYTVAQDWKWVNEDKKPFHVDHIIPIMGEYVSGLHVPWNLQLMIGSENIKKRNKVVIYDASTDEICGVGKTKRAVQKVHAKPKRRNSRSSSRKRTK